MAGDDVKDAFSTGVFRRVYEVVYYQKTLKFTGEIVPGIWERSELISRLGIDRLAMLERAGIIKPLAGVP